MLSVAPLLADFTGFPCEWLVQTCLTFVYPTLLLEMRFLTSQNTTSPLSSPAFLVGLGSGETYARGHAIPGCAPGDGNGPNLTIF